MLFSLSSFLYTANKEWDHFLHDYVHWWRIRLQKWVIHETRHPVHVVRYEDLQQDTVGEVVKMLNFLNVSYNTLDVESKLKEDFGAFHRKHDPGSEPEHYTVEQKSLIRTALEAASTEAKAHNKSSLLRLDEYLISFQ